VGNNVSMLLAPGQEDELSWLLASVARGERLIHLETSRRRKAGRLFDVSVMVLQTRGTQGRIVGAATITQDIVERKRIGIKLLENRAMLEAALSSMTDAVFISDAEGRFIHFNDAFTTFHRFKSREETLSSLEDYPAILEVFVASGAPAPLEQWAVPRALRGEIGTNVEYGLRRRDTGERWVASYSFAPIRSMDGTIVGSVVTGRDITEWKNAQAERKTRQLELARLAQAAEHGTDAIVSFDLDTRILHWSPGAERLYGFGADEVLGLTLDQLNALTSEPDATTVRGQEAVRTVLAGEPSRQLESRRRRKDGTILDTLVTMTPWTLGGKLIGLTSVSVDITERKAAERELARLAQAAEHGSDAIVSFDRDMRVRHWNRGAERISGFLAREVIGLSIDQLNDLTNEPEETRERVREAFSRLLRGGPGYQAEGRRRRRDGTAFDMLTTFTPWRVDGRVVGVTNTTVEITERKDAERAREGALAELEEAQRLARVGSWTWDPGAEEATWSAHMYEILGRDPAAGPAMGEALLSYVHPEDRQRVAERYELGAASELEFELDFRILTEQGEDRLLHAVGRRDQSQPGCYVGTFQDVTEQRRAERERTRVLEELHASEELFARGFEGSPIGMALTTLDGVLQRVNATFARLLGYDDPDQLTGLGWGAVTHPDDLATKQAMLKGGLESAAEHMDEARYLAKDGSVIHAITATALVRDTQEHPAILFTQIVDVTDRVQAQQALAESEANYRRILDTTLEGVWTLDEHSLITFVNPAMAEMLGCDSREMIGRQVSDFINPRPADETPSRLALHPDGPAGQREALLRGADGRAIWVLMSANPLYDAQGQYSGELAMVTDISSRRDMELRLQHLADHDPLTDIYNRRRLIEELDRQLRYAARSGRSGAVLVIDLDHLKIVNDTYGHATGDATLKAVAEVLLSRARETDAVARLGGDEFAVILPEATEHEAVIVASDVRALLSEQHIGPPITTSVGIVLFTGNDDPTADEVLVCADTALYEAKEHGGDQATLYTGQASGALAWVQRIRTSLIEDRFVLYGQPILDLRTGQVTHHELLIRMLSEVGEIIPAAQFIQTAERFGLIHEIDRWVTTAGLRLARHGRSVTINLSGQSIGQQPIIAAVDAAISGGLNPANVTFEITETAALSNITAARPFVDTLTGLGCSVALDDFGTGFGSFSYLKYIPARYLKIDIEFVRELAKSETDREVIVAIVGLAHRLNKLTIAEGVEDAETLSVLRSLGVDQAQGFHIGRPERISSEP
jgi:diguanylate cyclase (GGDEF)-like protein/PAS domain S-box-containing protein